MKITIINLFLLAILFYYFSLKQNNLEEIILKNSDDLTSLSLKTKKLENTTEINQNHTSLSVPRETISKEGSKIKDQINSISKESSEIKDQINSISKEIAIITREIEILKSYLKKKKNLNTMRKNSWRSISLGMNEFQVKSILGDPQHIQSSISASGHKFIEWEYENFSYVKFESKENMINRVEVIGYSEPNIDK